MSTLIECYINWKLGTSVLNAFVAAAEIILMGLNPE
jgi:hypothetical protein